MMYVKIISMETPAIDPTYVLDALQTLVRIDSTNPALHPGSAGEAEIAAYVAAELRRMGLAVEVELVAPGRPNVVGVLPGQGHGRSLLLNGHLDTVGVAEMEAPFSGELRDGKVYGRGAYDMKGSLAAMLGVAQALSAAGAPLGGDLLFTFVIDEETVSRGTEALIQTLPRPLPQAAIVGEPTDLAICRAHRGFVWFDVETFGRAAHGSRFQEGIDANLRMGRFLAKLDRLEQALRQRPPHPLVGPPSLHAARLAGGTEISMYAAHCRLQVERRTVPDETVAQTTAELQALLDDLAAADPTFKGQVRATFARCPLYGPHRRGHRARAGAGRNGAAGAAAGARRAELLDRRGPVRGGRHRNNVIIGPIGAGLHSQVEWVDVQSVVDLAHILAETAVIYCAE
jgi:acetylornithine deacetylase